MSYQTATYRLTGLSPLLMHNGQLADPLGYHAKELKKVSSKRVKTDADFERMAEIEFKGGLYLGEDGPVLPGDMVEATLIVASRRLRRSQQVKAGVIVEGAFSLEYDGPRDADSLWADPRFRLRRGVCVQKSRLMRTRPRFPEWGATVRAEFLPGIINKAELDDLMRLAGAEIGYGDWRPRYGRFQVAVI